ncbi:MAG TPA: hypothetical protein VEW94_07360 [Chloroflexia bacterium]|nr:hypothetical protein [Chloroflexia bacterium]
MLASGTIIDTFGVYPEFDLIIDNTLGWDVRSRLETVESRPNETFIVQQLEPGLGRVIVLEFERSLLERLLFPSLISVILLFTVLLAFVESLSTFIEGGVGVFFGIFGLRQALLPPGTEIRTILDFAIVGLYLCFAAVMMLQAAINIRKRSGSSPPANLESTTIFEEKSDVHGQVTTPQATAQSVSHSLWGLTVLIACLSLIRWASKRMRKS